MKQIELSIWLKIIILICALFGVLLCCGISPLLGKEAVLLNPELSFLHIPALMFIWVTGIPFYVILFNGWKICSLIAEGNTFCYKNSERLKIISILSIIESILYLVADICLVIIKVNDLSLFLVTSLIVFGGISLAIISAILSHIIKNASDLKEDNSLTI